MLRKSYKDHVTNEEVLNRMSVQRQLINKIRKQQLEFFGHIMRNKQLENIVVTGKIEGTRSRGRQRLTYVTSLSKWIGLSEVEMIQATRDRQRWKAITSYTCTGHGT